MPSFPDPRCKRRWVWGEYPKRVALFERGVALCDYFLAHNRLPALRFDNRQLNGPLSVYKPKTQRVYVDVRHTYLPAGALARQDTLSFPGHYYDYTALGVCAYEVGHHIANALHLTRRLPDWSMEPPIVVSPESDRVEALALAVRLLLTNPDLLRRGRPIRYWYLTAQLRLRPVEDRRWEDVLHGAEPAIFSAANRWIAHGITRVQTFLNS